MELVSGIIRDIDSTVGGADSLSENSDITYDVDLELWSTVRFTELENVEWLMFDGSVRPFSIL